jgi:hypothetical protein
VLVDKPQSWREIEGERIMQIVAVDDQDREKQATRHFLSHPRFRQDLLKALGMDSLTWVIMEAKKPHLVPGLVGDVDILAGNLQFNDAQDYVLALEDVRNQFPNVNEPTQQDIACKMITERLGLQWPPLSSRIVAVEVKCGYFSQADGPQSEKDSPKKIEKLRLQLDRLLQMGMDMVALLDVIGNDPTDGPGAYLEAGLRAQESARKFQPIIEARLTDEIPAAQFCWAVGSVFDRDEGFSGGGGLLTLRQGLTNPLLENGNAKTLENRKIMLQNVTVMLGSITVPRYCPVFFIDCQDCGRLHLLDDTTCGWKPRRKAVSVPLTNSLNKA